MHPPIMVPLWPDACPNHPAGSDFRSRLEIFLPKEATTAPRSAVVVCPGGGYAGLAPHEGRPFAEFFAARGVVGIVCYYRTLPHRFPAPVADALRAMRLVRHRAAEWGIAPDRVALMGFSAGGHLASTVATQPDVHHDPHDDLIGKVEARPNAVILAYPVISFVTKPHVGSANNLLGENVGEELRRKFSNELWVDEKTPPAFLFHTADDPGVPVENSLNFAAACSAHGVSWEMHVFRKGPHGVGLAGEDESLRVWPDLMADWLRQTLG